MFFEARRDPSEVFDPVEEAFGVVAFLVKGPRKAMAHPAIDLVGNVRRRALGFDPFPDPVRVVSLVAEDDATICKVCQQRCRSVGVMNVAGGQRQLDGQATGIGEGMDLGGQSSSRAVHTTNSVVFFTLAACR